MSREKKYYAVKVGKVTGILNSWEECKDSVHNYPGAVYKSFKSEEEAKEFLDASDSDKKTYVKEDTPEKNYAYVDGSINPETGAYGAGGFLIDNKGEKHILQGSGSDPEMMPMRNVAGEILGARIAIEKALSLGMAELTIFYDYQGIECWATGMWKRNKKGTEEYYQFCQSVKDRILLHFRKVKGHSGIDGNEEADLLAKEVVGIISCKKENKKRVRVCKYCGSARFIATAHVTQDWIIDGNGNFMECINDCVEVTHSPDKDDVWTCANCGKEAII